MIGRGWIGLGQVLIYTKEIGIKRLNWKKKGNGRRQVLESSMSGHTHTTKGTTYIQCGTGQHQIRTLGISKPSWHLLRNTQGVNLVNDSSHEGKGLTGNIFMRSIFQVVAWWMVRCELLYFFSLCMASFCYHVFL